MKWYLSDSEIHTRYTKDIKELEKQIKELGKQKCKKQDIINKIERQNNG